jgi:hypothetical protein
MAATMGAPGSVGGTTMAQVAPSVLLAEGMDGPLDAAVTAGVGAVAETILTNITKLYGTTRYFADDAMKVVVERSPALQAALEKYAAQVARAFTAACKEMSKSWPNLVSQARQAGKSPLDAITAHFKTILSNATLIAAPSSTKNSTGERDPEMHQTKKGNQWHFGMKAHIGADRDSGLVPREKKVEQSCNKANMRTLRP